MAKNYFFCFVLIPFISTTFAARESATPRELSSCLTLLCMDSGGCTAQGPKQNFDGNYFNIQHQTFAKCTYETEGQMPVLEASRVRQMSSRELEEAIAQCQRNYTCGSACIYNYYFTIWERCARQDVSTGREFSECEKMAFAYFDQNGWCDEKQHIWEKVRRRLPEIEEHDGESEDSETGQEIEPGVPSNGENGQQRGRTSPTRGKNRAQNGQNDEDEEQENFSDLFDDNLNDQQHRQRQNQQPPKTAQTGRSRNTGIDSSSSTFDLLDHLDDLRALAHEMGLAFEVRRAESSVVLAEKNSRGEMVEDGARLVLTDHGDELALLKVRAGGAGRPGRSSLRKTDRPAMLAVLRGICIGMFQN